MLLYEKNETKCFDIDEEINKNFIGETNVIFVKFKDFYKGKIIVKVCEYNFPSFLKI